MKGRLSSLPGRATGAGSDLHNLHFCRLSLSVGGVDEKCCPLAGHRHHGLWFVLLGHIYFHHSCQHLDFGNNNNI